MTELQQGFIFLTFVYFLVKGGLYIAIYVGTIILEKKALDKHAVLKVYLQHKRNEEQKRWKIAYDLYNRKYKDSEVPLQNAS